MKLQEALAQSSIGEAINGKPARGWMSPVHAKLKEDESVFLEYYCLEGEWGERTCNINEANTFLYSQEIAPGVMSYWDGSDDWSPCNPGDFWR